MTLMSGSTPTSSATATASVSTVQAGALRTNKSPGAACEKAYSTRTTASSSDIKNRVIVGSVTVRGSPASACFTNSGITEPREHMTFPYLTVDTVVPLDGLFRAKACAVFSMSALDMPIALMGCTALSVPRHTTERTPLALAACSTYKLPRILVCTAWNGKNPHDGTCLSAAAWNTRSTSRLACSTLP